MKSLDPILIVPPVWYTMPVVSRPTLSVPAEWSHSPPLILKRLMPLEPPVEYRPVPLATIVAPSSSS